VHHLGCCTVNKETLMTKLRIVGIASLLLIAILGSGCGNSALDKRNKFDACVSDWLKKYGYDFIGYNGAADTKAESACNYLLK
jgi:hypothetical protein